MVISQTGVLVTCDPQMKQFLIHLDQTKALGQQFVLSELDATHVLIEADIIPVLQARIDDLMDQLSFVEVN